MRTLRLRGDSNNPTSASRLPAEASVQAGTRRSALAPFPLSMLFLFRGGDFFKIEWAETGRGLLHYTIIVVYNVIVRYNCGHEKRVGEIRQKPKTHKNGKRHYAGRYCANSRR